VTNGTITNNIATGNGRHGINIVTGSDKIVVANNIVSSNGFNYNLAPSLGSGITVQSNMGIVGNTLYVTEFVVVQNNTIMGNANFGILFDESVNSYSTQNKIYGKGGCIGFSKTKNVSSHGDICIETITGFTDDGTNDGLVIDNSQAFNVPVLALNPVPTVIESSPTPLPSNLVNNAALQLDIGYHFLLLALF
jgi:parallel beta-helix repeat protein